MERERNNTGLVVAVTILAMLVLGLTGFIVYDKVINKTNEPDIVENNNGEQTQKDDDVYGYIAVSNYGSSGYRIVELHRNSKNKTIVSSSNELDLQEIQSDKLYYLSIESDSTKHMYIDLNDSSYSSVEVIDENLYNMEWNEKFFITYTDDYVFTAKDGNIWRYDSVTKEKKSIFEVYQDEDDRIGIYNLFVVDSTLYVGSSDGCDIWCTYFTIDFDGNNYQKITKNEFFESKTKEGIFNQHDTGSYLYYEDKLISVTDQSSDPGDFLAIDYEMVYFAKEKGLRLLYDLKEEKGTVVFEEFVDAGFEELDTKYYRYNINTKKLTQISKDETESFYDSIYVE